MEDLIAKLRGLRDDLFSVRGHGWTILDDALRALSDVPPDGIVKRSIDMQRRAETAEAALTAQAAEIERLTKERDKARHDFEIAAGDADFLLKSKQEAVSERDALKAENQKLREANGILEDALQEVGDDYPGSSCQEWCVQQIKLARAARQSGG